MALGALLPAFFATAAAGWFAGRRTRPAAGRLSAPPLPVAFAPVSHARLCERFTDGLPVPALMQIAADTWHANAQAKRHFGDSLSAVMRHPGMHGAIERFVAARRDLAAAGERLHSQEYPAPVTVLLELDVPVRRVVEASIGAWPRESGLSAGADDGAIDAAEGVSGVLVILDDQSEIEAVNRMRSDFVAHASHELRTPLASLVGFIETLQGPAAADPPAQQQFLGIMAAQAARMQRLIDRLLYLSRVQRLEHAKPQEMISAMDVVERLTEESAILVRDTRVTLSVALPDEDFFFAGDEDQLVQVLLNLVENAVKYGDPEVSISVAAQVGESGVRFIVSDTGPGIEARHIPRLTERFYRVESHGAARAAGTGLGLAIVKHIVDRHGGKLLIESTVGRGTRCTVWLPMR